MGNMSGFIGGVGVMSWLFCIPAAANGEFKLVKQDKEVTLYERWIPSSNEEPVREIQAVFYVRSDVAAVIRLLKNAALGLKWNMNTSRYQVQAAKDGSWRTYIRYDLPWPMDDQDCCLNFRVQPPAGGSGATVILFADNGGVGCPKEKKVSRLTGTRGSWMIEQSDKEVLKITYTVTSDRSKTIPRWISDPLVHKNLVQTMTAFKGMLEGEKKG